MTTTAQPRRALGWLAGARCWTAVYVLNWACSARLKRPRNKWNDIAINPNSRPVGVWLSWWWANGQLSKPCPNSCILKRLKPDGQVHPTLPPKFAFVGSSRRWPYPTNNVWNVKSKQRGHWYRHWFSSRHWPSHVFNMRSRPRESQSPAQAKLHQTQARPPRCRQKCNRRPVAQDLPNETSIGVCQDWGQVRLRQVKDRQVQNNVCSSMQTRACIDHEHHRSWLILQIVSSRQVSSGIWKAIRTNEEDHHESAGHNLSRDSFLDNCPSSWLLVSSSSLLLILHFVREQGAMLENSRQHRDLEVCCDQSALHARSDGSQRLQEIQLSQWFL